MGTLETFLFSLDCVAPTLTITFIKVIQTGVRDTTKRVKDIFFIWPRLKHKDSTLLIINNIDATLEILSLHLIFLILPGGTIIYLGTEMREPLILQVLGLNPSLPGHSMASTFLPPFSLSPGPVKMISKPVFLSAFSF